MRLSQIRLAHRVVVHERVGAAFLDDMAGFQHIGTVSDGKRHLRVLLDQQDRRARLIEL